MICKCGSQFLPTLPEQKKCFVCMASDACKKDYKTDYKKIISGLVLNLRSHNLCPPNVNCHGYCFKCWVDYVSDNSHDRIYGRTI